MLNAFTVKSDSVVAVDIGANLKMLCIDFRPKASASALKIISLPKEKKDEVIVLSLRDFTHENKITHKNAVLVPALESLLIKRIQLPAIPKAELAEAVKWKLKDEVPFDFSAADLDFSLIKESLKEDGSKVQDIIAAAAKEEEVRPQVMLLKQAGLNCLAVVPAAFAYARLAAEYFPAGSETQGLLHLGEDRSFLAVETQGKLEFFRELPFSRNKLRQALSGALVSDKGKIELGAQEIEEVLFSVGIPETEAGYKDRLSSFQITAMLRPLLERLAQEIRRSLNYYAAQFQGAAIKNIFIAEDSRPIPNVEKFLSRELPFEFKRISLGDAVSSAQNFTAQELAQSSAALGAALDFKNNINLLPQEFRSEKIEKLQKFSLRWVGLGAGLGLIIAFVFSLLGVSAYQRKLDSARLYLNVLSELSLTKEKIDGLNKFIADTRKLEPPLGALLKKISALSPKEIFLNEFSLHCEAKTLTIAGIVRSAAANPDIIMTKFMQDMEDSPYFADVNLSSVEREKTEEIETVKFKLNVRLP